MLPWVAAEWILCKEVVRVCRDAGKRRRAKILAVITAAADIPLVCLSLYIAFGLATMFRTPNGYCFHFSAGALGLGFLIGSLPMFVIAPFSALPVGLSCFGFFCFALGSFDFTHSSVLALSAYYFLVGAFMRGKIVCGASGRSQWRAVFVFWTTYWPHVLLSIILCLAEGTADITGHCCFDW